jgi:hypothetical protein
MMVTFSVGASQSFHVIADHRSPKYVASPVEGDCSW